MFFKKKKPEAPPEREHQAQAPEQRPSGQSMFAPGLGVAPTQIDFGFGNFDNEPAGSYSQSAPATSFDPWSPPEEVESWTPPVAPPAGEGVVIVQPAAQPDWMNTVPVNPVIDANPGLQPGIGSSSVSESAIMGEFSSAPAEFAVPPLEESWHDPQAVASPTFNMPPVPPIEMAPMQVQPLPQAMSPVENLSPEQAWAMLEPSAPAPALTDEASDFGIPAFESASLPPVNPIDYNPPSVAQTYSNYDDAPGSKMSQFESLPMQGSQQAPNALETTFDASWGETVWEAPASIPVNPANPAASTWNAEPAAYENMPVAPMEAVNEITGGFPPSSQSQNPSMETQQEWEIPAALSSPVPGPQDFSSDFNPPAEPQAASSLETLWEAPMAKPSGDLHSQFHSSGFEPAGAAEFLTPPVDITEPNWGVPEPGPDFSGVSSVLQLPGQELAGFNPAQASQEMAAGWAQLEQSSPVPEELGTAWGEESLPSANYGADWAELPGVQPEPIYFHEPPVSQNPEEQLWQNLSSPDAVPGEQVPYTSGAMMDSINEQLYPEDPFPSVNDEFAAGEQAFAEAARYLFPETVSAPLEWADSGYGSLEESEGGFGAEDEDDVQVLDLGASYSAPSDTFAELASAQLSASMPYVSTPEPEAFSGIPSDASSFEVADFAPIPPVTDPMQFDASTLASLTPPSTIGQPEPQLLPPAPSVQQIAPAETWADSEFSATAVNETWAPAPASDWLEADGNMEQFAPLHFAEPEITEPEASTTYAEPVIWTPDTVSTSGVAAEDTYEDVMGSISETMSWEAPPASAMENPAEWHMPAPWPEVQAQPTPLSQEGPAWDASPVNADWRADELAVARSLPIPNELPQPDLAPVSNPAIMPEPTLESGPALQAEADFYATAFALNEFGDLVPVHDDTEGLSGLEPPPYNLPAAAQPDKAFSSARTFSEPTNTSTTNPVVTEASGIGPHPYMAPQQPEPASFSEAPPAHPSGLSPVQSASETLTHSGPLPPLPQPVSPASQAPALEAPSMPAFSPEQFLAASRKRFVPPAPSVVDAMSPLSAPGPTAPQSPVAPAQVLLSAQPLPAAQSAVIAPQHSPAMPEPPQPQQVAEEPKIIRPKPLSRKIPSISPPQPEPQHSSPLEEQWYSPDQSTEKANAFAQASAPLPQVSAVEMKLTLGNLEVLGICQLLPEKRLLVVQHDGVYALMGQVGQEKSGLSVLKLFEQNPLAYQHTFTAVEEGKAGGQGMYVTQVGTWHAIISTFQDKISLHTELG